LDDLGGGRPCQHFRPEGGAAGQLARVFFGKRSSPRRSRLRSTLFGAAMGKGEVNVVLEMVTSFTANQSTYLNCLGLGNHGPSVRRPELTV